MLIITESGSLFNGNTDEKTWTFIIGIAHGYNRAKSNVQTKLVFFAKLRNIPIPSFSLLFPVLCFSFFAFRLEMK